MSDYTKYREKARSKITQYGNPIVLVQAGEETYNPSTNQYEKNEVRTNGVALQSRYSTQFIDGTNIKMGDIKFMTVIDKRPVVNDKLEYMGKVYTVINASEVNPNGEEPVYYDIQAR